MADFVEHTGVVESCDGQMVLVRIEQQAACASCHAKGACSVAEKEDKIIEVFYSKNDIKKGDKVAILLMNCLVMCKIAKIAKFVVIIISLFH
mgnify:CR=1 FL=1